jgi:hypothetical protein
MSSNELEFLRFKDWIESNEHLRSDWITVARDDKPSVADSRGTFSALIRNTDHDSQTVLASFEWNVDSDFGQPFFSRSEGVTTLNLGDRHLDKGVEFTPFTILRSFHTAHEGRAEIVQNFVLYHNLYWDPAAQKFLDSLKDEVVIEYVAARYVRIKTTYLKDYLAARKMILVRFHDHRRFVKKDVAKILGKESEGSTIRNKDMHYLIYIGKLGLTLEDETFSRLLGKDFVRPYEEPIHEEYNWLAEKPKQYSSFLIRVDEQGNRIESTCDERNLSNYFVDKGAPNFLTPIYFKQEVLKKYYDNSRYTASSYGVSFLDIWHIPIAINKEGLVHAWLGDLGRISYEEQLHWKQYNVAPSGGINEEFYKTQILAQFVEPKDPIYQLHQTREKLNKKTLSRFGFRIFKELREEDAYIVKSIHIPTVDEQKELDEQLIYLSKYLVDSLSKSDLEAHVTWRPGHSEEDTHIRFLQAFLIERLGYSETLARQSVEALRIAQALRSQSAAHVKSNEYQRLLERIGMARITRQQQFRKLVGLLNTSLSSITEAIDARVQE